MMRRWLIGVLVTGFAGPGMAADVVPGPVCAAPAVLQQVAEGLHRAGLHAVIETGSAGEAPGVQADIIRCALRVRSVFYDTARFGQVPQEVVRVVQYSLNRRRNGVFVRLDS